jgi:hypothetical protein
MIAQWTVLSEEVSVHLHFRLFTVKLIDDSDFLLLYFINRHLISILQLVIQDSVGIEHLKKLSDAGLTHVHLLPSFQFGGVDDIKSNWKCVGKDSTLSACFTRQM